MREIKFRAQGIASNKWLYGDVRHHKDDVCIFEQGGTKGEQAKRETVGQFTGLKDKNGKEIYEGDIVKHPYIDPIFGDLVETKDGDGVTSQVVFHDGAFVVKHDTDSFVYLDGFTRLNSVEVVGNIHDDPKLPERIVR